MIKDSLITLFFISVAAFIGWRLWRSVIDKQARIRGAVYVRAVDPVFYWLTIFFMVLGVLMTSAISLLFAAGLTGWIA